MNDTLYLNSQQPSQYWEQARSADKQNFIDHLERQLLDLQIQKKDQEEQALKTISLFQKTIEEKNNLIDVFMSEKKEIKSRRVNVDNHVDTINNLSLEVKRLKSELRQKNERIFELERKINQIEDDASFEIRMAKSSKNYEKALTYKLMQSPIIMENTSLKLINKDLEKQISELHRKVLQHEQQMRSDSESMRKIKIGLAAADQQQQLSYEDKMRTEKLMRDLGEEQSEERVVEVFKDDMLLQGVVEIFTRMRKMIVDNVFQKFIQSNKLSQKGEINSVKYFKDIMQNYIKNYKDQELSSYLAFYRQFKELVQHYFPDYGKILFQREKNDEEKESDEISDSLNGKINETAFVVKDRDQLNEWLVNNLVSLKQQRRQEKYDLKRDKQLHVDNSHDLILFQARHLFRHLALFLRIQNIEKPHNTHNISIISIMSRKGKIDNLVNIDQDLEIHLEEQIVIEYYKLLQEILKE